jgi:tetratricopeptide (TPR) repeat protein
VKEGLDAFKALQKKRIGAMELSQLALEVNRAGNPELAFELQSRVDAPGLQKLEMIMDAYRYLKKWKSEKDAVAWLRTRVPKNVLEPLSMFAFREKEDVVLWDVIPLTEGTAETTDYVWLTRAAASTRARDTDAAHQAALRKRFEVDRPGFYHQVGRHLLGLIPEQAVIAAAASAKNRQELPYFLGLKAQAEGRYEDAVTWYRATVETSNPKVGEYQWAYGELTRLKQAGLSLALLKQRAQ